MRGFLLNRLSQSLVLLVIVSIIGFTILSLIPGGPLSQYARDPSMTQQDIERLAAQLGLNRPIWIQYFDWAWRLVQGDWGRSFRDGTAVLAGHRPACLCHATADGYLDGDRDRHRHLDRHPWRHPAAIRCSTIWQPSAPWSRYRFRPSGSDLSASMSFP